MATERPSVSPEQVYEYRRGYDKGRRVRVEALPDDGLGKAICVVLANSVEVQKNLDSPHPWHTDRRGTMTAIAADRLRSSEFTLIADPTSNPDVQVSIRFSIPSANPLVVDRTLAEMLSGHLGESGVRNAADGTFVAGRLARLIVYSDHGEVSVRRLDEQEDWSW